MSDAQPDREQEGDAPAGPRNPWVGWIAWAVLAPVLYVLSVGPTWWLHRKGFLPEQFGMVYLPLGCLPDPVQKWLHDYYVWWSP